MWLPWEETQTFGNFGDQFWIETAIGWLLTRQYFQINFMFLHGSLRQGTKQQITAQIQEKKKADISDDLKDVDEVRNNV